MTPPRLIAPGATYLLTRCCIGKRYLLRPDKEMMQALLYCLALAAKQYRIEVHGLCVMSNHYHLIATDIDGKLPLFVQYFHRLATHCVQKVRDWDEVVWEPGRRTSMVELLDEGAIIDKTLYALCNPIKAGICRKEHQWPGTIAEGKHELKRPPCFRSQTMPAETTLIFTSPHGFDDADWHQTLLEQRSDARAEARQFASEKQEGCARLIGVKAALATLPTFRSRAKRTKGEINPCFASRCKYTLLSALKKLRAFYEAYRAAVSEYARGIATEFPEGTWKMKRLLGQS